MSGEYVGRLVVRYDPDQDRSGLEIPGAHPKGIKSPGPEDSLDL